MPRRKKKAKVARSSSSTSSAVLYPGSDNEIVEVSQAPAVLNVKEKSSPVGRIFQKVGHQAVCQGPPPLGVPGEKCAMAYDHTTGRCTTNMLRHMRTMHPELYRFVVCAVGVSGCALSQKSCGSPWLGTQ